jgi:hypothetical protein
VLSTSVFCLSGLITLFALVDTDRRNGKTLRISFMALTARYPLVLTCVLVYQQIANKSGDLFVISIHCSVPIIQNSGGEDHVWPINRKTKTARGFFLVIMLLFVLLGVAILNMKIINSQDYGYDAGSLPQDSARQQRYREIDGYGPPNP